MELDSELSVIIEKRVQWMLEKWRELDRPRTPTLDEISFFHHVDEIVRREAGIKDGESKVAKSLECRKRQRQDQGHLIYGDTVVLRVKITDHYGKDKGALESVAYFQVLPITDIDTPITRILEWRVMHRPSWIVWFTSPIAKGLSSRTKGEYIVAHTLTETETQDQNLLRRLGAFPCLVTSYGMDILLSFESLEQGIKMVEQFLPVIIERNLYGDPRFLEYLETYRRKLIIPLLTLKP
ncbi:MAG: hypothetical protein ACFFFG_03865 [Candidatus Thorarchaeota archaeon]